MSQDQLAQLELQVPQERRVLQDQQEQQESPVQLAQQELQVPQEQLELQDQLVVQE